MRAPFSFRWGVCVLTAVALVVVWGFYARVCRDVLRDHTDESIAQAETMVRAYEKNTHRAIHEVDVGLRNLALLHAEGGLAAIRRFIDQDLFDRTLIHHFTVLDDKGDAVFRSQGTEFVPGPRDEAMIAFHQGTGRDLLYIAPPYPGAADGSPLLRFSRRLTGPDGGFGGIVSASVDPDVLEEFYQQTNLGPNGIVTLVGLDTIIRARGARIDSDAVGLAIPHSRLWEALKRSMSGVYWQRSISDGYRRAFAYRMVEGYPLVVAVGVAEDDIQAATAELRNTLFVLALLLSTSILLVALFLLVQHRSAERLRAALDLNRNFLARVSHELRTPLNAILGFSEVIRDRVLGEGATARYADYARDIHESGRHLLALINDLLDLSQLQAGRMKLQLQSLNVVPAIEWAVRMVAADADAKGVKVDIDVPPGRGRLTADEHALKQMLLNLLVNAVAFTPNGGRVLVTVGEGEDGRCRVRVMDNGIGMTPEQLRQAVLPFGQPTPVVARSGQGSGIGLSIVKSLMEAHGGQLHIDSRPGQGSQVTLEFAPAPA